MEADGAAEANSEAAEADGVAAATLEVATACGVEPMCPGTARRQTPPPAKPTAAPDTQDREQLWQQHAQNGASWRLPPEASRLSLQDTQPTKIARSKSHCHNGLELFVKLRHLNCVGPGSVMTDTRQAGAVIDGWVKQDTVPADLLARPAPGILAGVKATCLGGVGQLLEVGPRTATGKAYVVQK